MKVGDIINPSEIGKRSFDPKELLTAMRKGAFWTLASWGAHAFVIHEDKFARFMVQGRKHYGHVYIILGWDDTFTVILTTLKGKVLNIDEGVYVDVLVQTIDRRVES